MKRLFQDEEISNGKKKKEDYLEVGEGKIFQTITQALEDAIENQIIYVFNGIYQENLRINKDGVKIIGKKGEKVVIESKNKYNFCLIF